MAEGAGAIRGLAALTRAAPQGMITLRGDPAAPAIAAAVRVVTGQAIPGVRRIAVRGASDGLRGAAWMSPDEALLFVPYSDVIEAVAQLQAALAQEFALVADISDARAMFRLQGRGWREVLARLCPVDFAPAAFVPGDFRRTRAAQVAAAVWAEADDTARLLCFRSVAAYMEDLLRNAADPACETGLYGPV